MFYAHSIKDAEPAEWELLRCHLKSTSHVARGFAAKFNCGDLGAVAGLLHDFGKYSVAFQQRLRDPHVRAPHAAHGAALARARYGIAGHFLAHGIAGHHGGLSDDLFDPDGRLAEIASVITPLIGIACDDGLVLPDSLSLPDLKRSGQPGFQRAFLARMLFSCLVDADYLATERFYAEAQGDALPVRGATASLADLKAALDRHLACFPTPAPGSLNARRTEILAHACSRAAASPGVFTLTVPTGGGKTLTSLSFALDHALAPGHVFDRVVVAIPFTSVIEQSAAIYRSALAPYGDAVLEHHSAFDATKVDPLRSGRDKLALAMENWDRPLIVTTTVQLFESLFSNRPSQCRKLHNLARSIIVLDEVQTLPPGLLRPCVAALKELVANYGCSVVLCTATQPALLADPGPTGRPFTHGFTSSTELAPDPPSLFEAMRRVRVEHVGKQTNDEIAGRIAATDQVLCIVNTRAHAQKLFRAVADLPGARHLSTLMYPAHRQRVLAEIRADLLARRPCRVVSTSLVEAGVDVDFPLVLRAEAGLDSILQAAGRANREGRGDPEQSFVLVFSPEDETRIQKMRIYIESGAAMFRQFADVTTLDAVKAYFSAVFDRLGDEGLDIHALLAACKKHERDLNFPFAQIASDFQMIDDYNEPIIVEADEVARDGVRRLRTLPEGWGVGGIARALQRYVVGVPPRARFKLVAEHAAEVIDPSRYGDQFVVLTNADLYRDDIGLFWDDPTLMDPSG